MLNNQQKFWYKMENNKTITCWPAKKILKQYTFWSTVSVTCKQYLVNTRLLMIYSWIFTRLINFLSFHVKQGRFQVCIFSSPPLIEFKVVSSPHRNLKQSGFLLTTLHWAPTRTDQFEVGGAPPYRHRKAWGSAGDGLPLVYHYFRYLGKY